jgi:hypothetical protein
MRPNGRIKFAAVRRRLRNLIAFVIFPAINSGRLIQGIAVAFSGQQTTKTDDAGKCTWVATPLDAAQRLGFTRGPRS